MKNELQNIISGKGTIGAKNIIQTAASYLRASQKTGGKVISTEFTKEQEAEELKLFIKEYRLWSGFAVNEETKIGEGPSKKYFST